MSHPKHIYELLLDHCDTDAVVNNLIIGLVWTLCQSDQAIGLAMSPTIATRTLAWPGSLINKPIKDLAAWILNWDPHQAALAMAAINSCINARSLPADSIILKPNEDHANLSVFEHFLPQLFGKKVVVIGHYPGIERYQKHMQLSVLERQPIANDLPDSACEFLLPEADWVFLTASSIPNKTFPRLAELSSAAKTVLMGPTLPWLPELREFGIDYLAGVEIKDAEILYQTAAQGGGVKIFNQALHYRIAKLTPKNSLKWIKQHISECTEEKNRLTEEMENWYASGNSQRFPKYQSLERINRLLSKLDSHYQPLWDTIEANKHVTHYSI